jgi:hypothetical protein
VDGSPSAASTAARHGTMTVAVRLHLACARNPTSGLREGDVAVAFDRLALPALAAQGVESHFVDDLLDWKIRMELEDEVAEVLERIGQSDDVRASEVEGYALGDVGRYDLRIGITDALRTAHVLERALEGRTPTALSADAGCTDGVLEAAEALTGLEIERSLPKNGHPPALHAANQLLRIVSLVRSPSKVRILGVPGAKVYDAFRAIDGRTLRSLGVGVAAFPDLVGGGAARLALTRSLPAIVAERRNGDGTEVVRLHGPVHPRPATDAAVRAVAERILSSAAGTVRELAPAVRALDACRSCRAVVLPSTSGAAAQMLRSWALRRGLTCAVVQHGIYVFRAWDGGDRDADVLLAWGPGVGDQVAGGPDVRPVGVPGLVARRRTGARERRMLIATTNAPTGSALGMHGFCEAFMDCVVPELGRMLASGWKVVLRPHPSEDEKRYAELLGSLAESVEISRTVGLHDQIATSALVVSSVSSAAVEAAAVGTPVALWLGVPVEARRKYLLTPFDSELPGCFRDAAGFSALVAEHDLTGSRELSEILRQYAMPFDAEAFASALADLDRA